MALLCLRFICSLFINTAVFLLRGCEFEQLGAAVGLVSFCGWRTGSSVPMLGRLRFSGHVLWDGLWPALGRSAESSSTSMARVTRAFSGAGDPPVILLGQLSSGSWRRTSWCYRARCCLRPALHAAPLGWARAALRRLASWEP